MSGIEPEQQRLPGQPDADTVRAIEAIILVAVEPVPAELLAQLLEQPTAMVERLCAELARTYDEAGHGFTIAKVAGGYRYQTQADLAPYVERFLLHDQRARLSGAALETLAIIAYKQPILRADVESIRGVACGETIRSLMEKHLVRIAGRAEEPGRPILYGTTKRFLELFGLNSVKDLPQPEALVEKASG
jgi:segregation and condensation protein B